MAGLGSGLPVGRLGSGLPVACPRGRPAAREAPAASPIQPCCSVRACRRPAEAWQPLLAVCQAAGPCQGIVAAGLPSVVVWPAGLDLMRPCCWPGVLCMNAGRRHGMPCAPGTQCAPARAAPWVQRVRVSSSAHKHRQPSLPSHVEKPGQTMFRGVSAEQPSSFTEPVLVTRDAPLPPARCQRENAERQKGPRRPGRRACALGGHAVDGLRRLRVAV